MTKTHDWSQGELERLEELRQPGKDARALHNGNHEVRDYVPPSTCEEWRRLVREDDIVPEQVPGQGFADSTIRKHITGRCGHEDSGSAVRYTGTEWIARE